MNISDPLAPSSEQLAARSRGGCLVSFEQLVGRYEAQIFNFLNQFTRNRHDAEDLTQDTFVKAWRGLARFNPEHPFAPWLFCIARRTAVSHFRSVDRFEELPEDREVVEENPANLLVRKDEQNTLWRLARTLKPKQWEVLWLRYHEGFAIVEIARILGTNQIHVKVLLHRARAQLSKLLNARGISADSIRRPREDSTATRNLDS